MELFAPEYLPGVGMGDLNSVTAICGLLGLAVTVGALIAEGVLGTIVFVASALLVLSEKPDLGGSVPSALVICGFLLVLAGVRFFLASRARAVSTSLVGAARDSADTKSAEAANGRRLRWARLLAFIGVIFAGAAAGFAWAEWNEMPLRIEDAEAGMGIALGLLGAIVGGDAAYRFIAGATRAGGSRAIVSVVVVVVALTLNAASVYVPFVGGVVFVLALILAMRLRKREQAKPGGLRILS